MNRELLLEQLKALSLRVNTLLNYANSNQSQHPELLSKVLEELADSLEQLRTLQEVLRQQNQELLESQATVEVERQRYRDLFEFAPDGYLITDPGGKIQQANLTASDLLKIPQKYIFGKPLAIFFTEAERRTFYHQLDRLLQIGQIQDWITQLKPRDAVPFDAALTASTVCDRTGKIVGIRWLVRDISQRQQAESLSQANTLDDETTIVNPILSKGLTDCCLVGRLNF